MMMSEIILIAEDNEVLRAALKEMLSMAGYTMCVAANGVEALQQMKMLTPHLIISDISMPEMDGYDFFKAVREQSEWLSIPFIFLSARGTKQDILSGKDLGAEDYLVKPVHRDELLTAVRSKLDRSNQLRIVRLREAYESSLTVLANAIEVRDSYTRGHVERVRDYALMLARQLGWTGQALDDLRYGAILHDIGKIHIRESILHKSDPLSTDEWEEIKTHPAIGAEMIRGVPYLAEAVPIVYYHHEHWDGSGYPEQLTGEDVPIAARIVVVADAFDAMTTKRAYQTSRTLAQALNEIVNESGKKYDPTIVAVLQDAWDMGVVAEIAA
jgi:putative two-component system response regulator